MAKIFNVNDINNLYKTGIYKITCKNNGKVYIGSACGSDNKSIKKNGFYRRWLEHLNKLKLNRHRNKILQNAYNKYGEDSFIFEIIEICERKIAKEREEYYINDYPQDMLFNILRGHLANYNTFTEEHKTKISQSLKGKRRPIEVIQKWSNRVQQLNENQEVVGEYYSMSEAERMTGIMRQDIGQAIIGRKMKKAGGYFWRKVKDIV